MSLLSLWDISSRNSAGHQSRLKSGFALIERSLYSEYMFPTHIKILICDDMPTIRDMVGSELRRLGYTQHVSAPDGADAWKIYSEALERDPFGMIISDWNMPKLTGIEFLKKVRSHDVGANTPFILLTAEGQKEQVLDAISAGVTQYILKPFSSKSFEDKLKAAWQKVISTKAA